MLADDKLETIYEWCEEVMNNEDAKFMDLFNVIESIMELIDEPDTETEKDS